MAVAILDIDGTLVDTNYQHAIAWYRAFRRYDLTLPIWRIHRHIGMGGDQLVPALAGDDFESEHGDAVRDDETTLYGELIGEVQAVRGARELIEELARRGHTVLLASSAKQEEVDHYLDLLDARELADGWTSSADVESTKPEPDLVQAALKKAGAVAAEAVMIGDTPYDVEAAKRAEVPTLAVLTGGFSEQELRDAGARMVYESVVELREGLDGAGLSRPGRARLDPAQSG
ncbi:MAG TPA: HAD family hydrolase [Solirubrobacteraceae bacterium]|jgi:HAD superfamily hydrolase (TIGR01549 family)|nr:HAD family hydrolase [Solirubrobacteraceae bacterium]